MINYPRSRPFWGIPKKYGYVENYLGEMRDDIYAQDYIVVLHAYYFLIAILLPIMMTAIHQFLEFKEDSKYPLP